MKAIVFERTGEPLEVLKLGEAPEPQFLDGEIVVEVRPRPIQPSDEMFIRGQYRWKPRLPQVAGVEGAGLVVASAAGSGIEVGARVAFRGPGPWAQAV